MLAAWTSLLVISPLHTAGNPPDDGPKPNPVPYLLRSVLIVSIVSGIGMVCAIICLVLTVAYRKHK